MKKMLKIEILLITTLILIEAIRKLLYSFLCCTYYNIVTRNFLSANSSAPKHKLKEKDIKDK